MSDLVIKGIDQSTGMIRRVTASDTAVKTDLSTIVSDQVGAPNGLASLDALSLVVQDPASAVTTVTANAIVKRMASGAILVSALEAPGATSISLSTNSVEHVRINSSGQVLVGADMVNQTVFNVFNVGANTTTGMTISVAGGSPIKAFYHSNGTLSSPTVSADADVLGLLYWNGYTSAGHQNAAYITARAATTYGGTGTATAHLTFGTANAGGPNLVVERWRITNTGALRGMNAGSTIDWTTGLGAITHILGPTDQNLDIRAGARAGAGEGYHARLFGGAPSNGQGGSVLMIGADGVGTSMIGGSCYMLAGRATDAQGGGYSFVWGGQGGSGGGLGGHVQIIGGLGGTAAVNGGNIDFQTCVAPTGLTRVTRWTINAPGHLITGADNTYDIGASGATRPRTLHVGTSIIVAGGTAHPVTISQANIFGDGNLAIDAVGSTEVDSDVALYLGVASAPEVQLGSTSIAGQQTSVQAQDIVNIDVASDGTAINIGTNAAPAVTIGDPGGGTAVTIYGGNTQINMAYAPAGYPAGMWVMHPAGEAIYLGAGTIIVEADGVNNRIRGKYGVSGNTAGEALRVSGGHGFGSGAGGTFVADGGQGGDSGVGGDATLISGAGGATSGNSGNTYVRTGAVTSGTVGVLELGVGGASQWRVDSSGHYIAITDNTHDIGAAGATRPRSIYARTSFIAEGAANDLTMSDGSITQSAGGLTITSTAAALTLAATGANTVAVHTNGSARLTVADATVTVADALDFVFNATTGTKFGTATGQKLGWWNASPVVQQAVAALTNNITSGGTDDTLDNYTDLTTYATDASAIRNNLYQLGRKLDQVVDALRLYGLLG